MNKKGFTLIELLAIIVILAVIALISTPIITSTIANVRKNADRESANSYISTVETKLTEAALQYPNIIIGTSLNATTSDATRKWSCQNCDAGGFVNIEFKGTAPQKANLTYNPDTGRLSGKLKYVNGCWQIDANGNLSEITTTDTFCN